MKTYQINSQSEMPALGFGTWKLKGKEGRKSVETALDVGYRHIDTADVYENHQVVGKTLDVSNIDRENLFITSKVWRTNLAYQAVLDNVKRFLDELNLEYLNLVLVHWPNKNTPIQETLKALNELKDDGLIKATGVSNFTINHLKDALDTEYDFSVNQVEFHPSLNQQKLKQFCDKNDIHLTAYSPIAQGQDLNLEIIKDLAEKYCKPECQVILNWLIQQGLSAIPRSSNLEHIRENFETTNWSLDEDDINKINTKTKGLSNRLINPGFNEFDY